MPTDGDGSTAFAAITLSPSARSLAVGSVYAFDIWRYTTSNASGGIKVDLNGGSATATTLLRDSQEWDGTAIGPEHIPLRYHGRGNGDLPHHWHPHRQSRRHLHPALRTERLQRHGIEGEDWLDHDHPAIELSGAFGVGVDWYPSSPGMLPEMSASRLPRVLVVTARR